MIAFSGEITVDIELEFRKLYYQRPVVYPILYSVSGTFALICGIFTLAPAGKINEPIIGILLLLMATLLFVAAFRIQHIYWHWWWPKFLKLFGKQLYGEVSERGIKFKADGQIVKWKLFTAIKQTPTLIIIYFDKASAYPIHQSMTSNSSEWQTLIVLTKKNVHRKLL
jgi:hypothetical protein